ncbi:hypothetical protein BCV70DRAFT_199004 [Testicularia cyperi]|uniref:Uncharacterized protein n=1 Tax=Testicularia cyperi TaxID=1882483 RepID=A0A317XUU4_9BASI|nr:hypothetical protein BCV70DRAFT_199004 [Testicularia cyperi]
MVAHDDGKSKDKTKAVEDLEREPVLDFDALPPEAIQSYIAFYDLAKSFPPQELSEQAVGSSTSSRKRKARAVSPGPAASSSRKRNGDSNAADITSSTTAAAAANGAGAKVADDDPPCPPHFFDADAATHYLGQVASHHFSNQPAPKEGEVVVGFLYKCRAKGELNRPLAHYRLRDGPSIGAGRAQQRPSAAVGRSR